MTDVPDISFTEFEGEWKPEVPREKTKLARIEDEIEAALLGRENISEVQNVDRIWHELTFLTQGHPFKYLLNAMLIQLVRIQENLKHTRIKMTPKEIKEPAN
jgi:hypothetical protein